MKKRIISISLALVLFLSCVFSFTSCMSSDGPGVNAGYKSFNNGDISFDYPEDWMKVPFIKTFNGMDMIMDLGGSGNNIIVYTHEKTDFFKMIDNVEKFDELMRPEYEASGFVINEVTVESGITNGLEYVIFSFDAVQSDNSFIESQIITNAGNYTYMITITEVVSNPAMIDTIISTLSPAK